MIISNRLGSNFDPSLLSRLSHDASKDVWIFPSGEEEALKFLAILLLLCTSLLPLFSSCK